MPGIMDHTPEFVANRIQQARESVADEKKRLAEEKKDLVRRLARYIHALRGHLQLIQVPGDRIASEVTGGPFWYVGVDTYAYGDRHNGYHARSLSHVEEEVKIMPPGGKTEWDKKLVGYYALAVNSAGDLVYLISETPVVVRTGEVGYNSKYVIGAGGMYAKVKPWEHYSNVTFQPEPLFNAFITYLNGVEAEVTREQEELRRKRQDLLKGTEVLSRLDHLGIL